MNFELKTRAAKDLKPGDVVVALGAVFLVLEVGLEIERRGQKVATRELTLSEDTFDAGVHSFSYQPSIELKVLT